MDHSFADSWGRVVLSPLLKRDIEKLRAARNRERQWFVYSEEISKEGQIAWYEKYAKTPGDYMFSVSVAADPEVFVGAAALYNVDESQRRAEFGRLIIDKSLTEEKGLGLDATACACKIGFERLGLTEIYLEVFSNNAPAIAAYKKAGFAGAGFSEDGGILYMSHLVKCQPLFKNNFQ